MIGGAGQQGSLCIYPLALDFPGVRGYVSAVPVQILQEVGKY